MFSIPIRIRCLLTISKEMFRQSLVPGCSPTRDECPRAIPDAAVTAATAQLSVTACVSGTQRQVLARGRLGRLEGSRIGWLNE